MARNHTPKPLYGSRKVANDAVYCTAEGCKADALMGYRRPNGTYEWRCLTHRRSAKVVRRSNEATRALLRAAGFNY